MASDVQTMLRTAESYVVATEALVEMQRHRIWPTPLNYELWLHVLAEPDGDLAKEMRRLIARNEPITEAICNGLADTFLPHRRISENLFDTGDLLSRQIDGVSDAIAEAKRSSADYGRALAGATEEMQDASAAATPVIVRNLTEATLRIQTQNAALEKRLTDSTREVDRLKQNLDIVRRDAMTDALTNLANRKAFDEGLAKAVAQAQATGGAVALAVLDIDHFKRFNDTWGHQTGDQVIRYVASVIDRAGQKPRTAARYGGEEFAIIFPGETAQAACRTLRQVLTEISSRTLKRRSTNEELGSVTISAGVAELRRGEEASGLLGRADQALYASKRCGRNRVTDGGTAGLAEVA